MQQAALTIGAFLIAVVVLGYGLSRVLATGSERVAPAPTVAVERTAVAMADRPAEASGGEASSDPGSDPPAAEPDVAAPDAPKPITFESIVLEPNYTVEPGDTLGTIAERSGNTVDALVGLNNLPDRDGLSVGQSLIVPES